MNRLQFRCQPQESVIQMENQNNSSTGQVDWKVIGRIEYIKNKPCHTISLVNKEVRNLETVLNKAGPAQSRGRILQATGNLSTLCRHLIQDSCGELKQIQLQNLALKIQTVFEAKDVIISILMKRLESIETVDKNENNGLPSNTTKPICTYCRTNLNYQRLQSIKAQLDQRAILKLHDSSIPIPGQEQQEYEEDNADLEMMVSRFLNRKNQILSAKVSNVDFMLNEALNIMQSNSKVHNYYKVLSNEELVILLNNSKTIVNSVCKQIDDQFRGSMKKQLTTAMNKICMQYYNAKRAKEREAMESHDTQTIQSKNGLSTRSLEMKIEALKKELGEKTEENKDLIESIVQLKESSEKAKISLNIATNKMQQTVASLQRAINQKNDKITQMQVQILEINMKLQRASQIQIQTATLTPTEKKTIPQGKSSISKFNKTTLSNKSLIKTQILEIHKQTEEELQDKIDDNIVPQAIDEGLSSESQSQQDLHDELKSQDQLQQSKQNPRRDSIKPIEYVKPQYLNPINTNARKSVARVSKLLTSATSLSLLAAMKERNSNRGSSHLNSISDQNRQSIQEQQHQSSTAPITKRFSYAPAQEPNTSNQVITRSPSTQFSGVITPQSHGPSRNHSLSPVINITIDPPARQSLRTSISVSASKFQKKVSGLNLNEIPSAMLVKKYEQIEEGSPQRSSLLRNGGGSSFNKYYQNIKNIQNALTKVSNSSSNKNSIEVLGYSSLNDFHVLKDRLNGKKSCQINTTPRNELNQRNFGAMSEQKIPDPSEKQNITQPFSVHTPEKKKVSIQTVQLFSSKFFPKFTNAIKEAKRNSKIKIPSKKKKLRQILRKDFDMEDLDLFIGVSEAYQFEQSNQHKIDESVDLDNLIPEPIKEQMKDVYSYIQSLKKSSPAFYYNLKNFLKYPYQTAVCKLYEFDRQDSLTFQAFEQVMIKLLVLHKKCHCHSGKFYCNHIRDFFIKIGYRGQPDAAVSVRSLLPTLTEKQHRIQ